MTATEAKSGENVAGNQEEQEERPDSTPPEANVAMRCVLKGNVERFVKCFEDEEDPFFSRVEEQMNERDEGGKTPLDMAATLGRLDMMRELITRGADVNATTGSGYGALHHAACWGKIDCLKLLVESEADLQQRTKHNERAREIAMRYNQAECMDYLDWAEARQALLAVINTNRENLADPEKVKGFTRDDKNTITNLCNEKNDWVENTPDATTQDFITHKQLLEEAVAQVWAKLTEPPAEKPEKK